MDLGRAIDDQIKLELAFIQIMKQEFQRIREALDECVRRHPTDDAVAEVKESVDTILNTPPPVPVTPEPVTPEPVTPEPATPVPAPVTPVSVPATPVPTAPVPSPVPTAPVPARARPPPPPAPAKQATQENKMPWFGSVWGVSTEGGTRRLKRKRTRRLPKHTK